MQASSQKDIVVVTSTTEQKEKLHPKEDHGMSKPEDRDMYTTRSP